MFVNPSIILTTIVGCLALASSPVMASPTPSSVLAARGWIGGVDVDKACNIENGNGWSAVRVGSSCYDWKCQRGSERRDVNMAAACVAQYGLTLAYAGCKGGIYDWACYID
ncbi:hypothetical protein QBC47DRAFT_404153 [Echria macrotheca]|uniref:Uncharacterized protein n=1 Tax=Echria macrotheca TaxID=438768 RepID=A0AAJ0FA52_9PEZI|nr:hypothetical protein QBC47DRAFT_404153 [Echria macrotheca]